MEVNQFSLPEMNLGEAQLKEINLNELIVATMGVVPVPNKKDELKDSIEVLSAKRQLLVNESDRIRAEAERAILKLLEDRKLLDQEMMNLRQQLRDEEMAEAERLRKEAELEAMKSEAERMDSLVRELENSLAD